MGHPLWGNFIKLRAKSLSTGRKNLMSYRTTVEDYQIFGNNESFQEWYDFIKSEDIDVDEEGCYDGYITNVMGAIEAIESIIENFEKGRRLRIAEFKKAYKNVSEDDLEKIKKNTFVPTSIFDHRSTFDNYLSQKEKYPNDKYNNSLTDDVMDLYNNGYIFMSINFIKACGNKIEPDHHFATPGHFYCYKIKDGNKIHVHAG